MSDRSVAAKNLPSRLLRIAEEIRAAGGRCFLVGGWVRDFLLGRLDGLDFDIEVYHVSQDTLLEILNRHGRPNLVGKSFGVIHMVSRGHRFDFSFPRLETKVGAGHRAFVVETYADLDFATAAARRDFTMNAMGMELPELSLIDPHGGERDLRAGVLRHVGPAFVEDPLRVLRGVQFAARFGLRIAPETLELCKTLDLRELSRERVFEELRKWLMKSARPSVGLHWFVQMELTRFFPQVVPYPENDWERLGRLLDFLTEFCAESDGETRELLMFAGLVAANVERTPVLSFLELITQEIRFLRLVPEIWQEGRELARVLRTGEIPGDAWWRRQSLRLLPMMVVPYARAWLAAEGMHRVDWEALQHYLRRLGIWDRAPQPFLTGKMLIGLGYKPGPHFGEWITRCFEEQLEGNINSAEEALDWARRHLRVNASDNA